MTTLAKLLIALLISFVTFLTRACPASDSSSESSGPMEIMGAESVQPAKQMDSLQWNCPRPWALRTTSAEEIGKIVQK